VADAVDARTVAPARLTSNWNFLRLWLGQVASTLGSGVSQIAMPLLVLALTDSPALAGLVAAARTGPFIVLGLLAGALIDRLDRRTILIFCDLARGLAMASVPLTWVIAGSVSVVHLLAVALVHGTALAFANLAQVAALARLVRKDQIASAQALSHSSTGIASLLGPGMGGFVISLGATTASGAMLAFTIDAVTYFISVAMLLTIKAPFQETRASAGRAITREILEGLRYLWHDLSIRLLAFVNAAHRLCVGPVVVLVIVIFARDELQADPAAIGLLVSAAGAGGLVGSALTPALRRRLPVGWHMIGVVAIHGIGLGLLALSGSIVAAIGAMLVVGMMEGMTSVLQVSYRLAVIPDALQGRVNSVYRLMSFSAMTIGTMLSGVLVEATNARTVLWLMAATVVLVALVASRTEVRRL
jgi:MFS family permease